MPSDTPAPPPRGPEGDLLDSCAPVSSEAVPKTDLYDGFTQESPPSAASAQALLPASSAAQYMLQVVGLGLAYFAAGKLGLSVPFTSWNVSPVWPASGVAMAAVLLWGYRVWPGIALGAFLVNFFSPIPHLAALGIAAGNTSSALVCRFLLCRTSNFHLALNRLRDVLALTLFGAAMSTIVAAIVGTTTLFLTHVRPWSDFATSVQVWWLGDAMGVLIVAPLLLTGRELWKFHERARALELSCLLLAATLGAIAFFTRSMGLSVQDDVLAFAVFPFVVWAAIRFRAAGASATCFLIAAVALWGTAEGYGPFARHVPVHNAILLQLFLAVIGITGLILAAVMQERAQAESVLRQLSARLLHLQDEERRRLARELHDSAGQQLAALQMNLDAARRQTPDSGSKISTLLVESMDLVEQMMQEIRTLSYLLHPPLLDESGLDSAIRWYVDGLTQRSKIKIDLSLPPEIGRVSQDLETAIFRVVQECLTNVHRHSGSSRARIQIVEDGHQIRLTVRDWGKGVPPDLLEESSGNSTNVGVGIRGMRERVREFGGHLTIRHASPGTVIEVEFPLIRPQEAGYPQSESEPPAQATARVRSA